jgi:transcriptional regulator with XRE-family HTH domain
MGSKVGHASLEIEGEKRYFPNIMIRKTRTSSKRPSAKLKPPAWTRAGGEWGDELRDRIRSLIASRGETQAGFAAVCDVDPPRITEWLSGQQLPSAQHLRTISQRTKVSVDWLFFGEGPMYRGQSRDPHGVEQEVAAYVARELLRLEQQGRFFPGETYREWDVDAGAILTDAVDRAADAYRAYRVTELMRDRIGIARTHIAAEGSVAGNTFLRHGSEVHAGTSRTNLTRAEQELSAVEEMIIRASERPFALPRRILIAGTDGAPGVRYEREADEGDR